MTYKTQPVETMIDVLNKLPDENKKYGVLFKCLDTGKIYTIDNGNICEFDSGEGALLLNGKLTDISY